MGDTRRHRGESGAATIDSLMDEQGSLGIGRESRFGGGSGVPCESTHQVGRRFPDRSEGRTPRETDDVPSSVQTIVCELLRHMGDLHRRLEVLEAREGEESSPAAGPERTPDDNGCGPRRDINIHRTAATTRLMRPTKTAPPSGERVKASP
jgi:hypothetical protein